MMFILRIKRLFFLFLMMLLSFSVKAQQPHFVYLQTDNGQPFYVKMNNNIISSSAEGYVILPGISDGVYKIAIGFPKKEHPEENFTLNIDKNNEGFLIKNFEDKGLRLFNLETLALINGTKDSNTVIASVPKDVDPFSKMLANVVKDSSILQNHQAPVPIPVTTPVDSQKITPDIAPTLASTKDVMKDSSILQDHQVKVPTPVTASVDSQKPTPDITRPSVSKVDSFESAKINSSVSKLLSQLDTNGLLMVYVDKNNQKNDTVHVFIPSQKEQHSIRKNIPQSENKNNDISSFTDTEKFTITTIKPKMDTGFVFRKDSIAVNKDSNTSPVQIFVFGTSKKEKIAADEDNNEQKNDQDSKGEIILLPKVVTSSKVNSDCKAFASNEDFLRLRKKMAAENNREDMIKAAKKYFKNKCFSTDQIKNLSYLFLNDEGRYDFFDAAYAHTSDSDQYHILEAQLTDEYYLNRFRAMIRK